MGHFEITVETADAAPYGSVPRRVRLGSRDICVAEVVDEWPSSDHRYFKVRGDDGGLYILRHDLSENAWSLTLFDQTGGLSTSAPGPAKNGHRMG